MVFFKRWRLHYLADMYSSILERDDTLFIGYTHFGYDGYPKKVLFENWSSTEQCSKNSSLLRKMLDHGEIKNTTIRQHVIESGLL